MKKIRIVYKPIATSTIKIAVLHGAHILNEFAIWTLMAYFKDVWSYSPAEAAEYVNLLDAGANILSTGFLFLARKYTGHYLMFMLSIFASTMGLGLLSLSSLFSKDGSTLACIGLVVLSAVGRPGFLASYEELVAELKPLIKQKRKDNDVIRRLEDKTEDENPNMIAKNKEEMKANNRKKIIKKLKACVIVFILPFLVSFIMSFISMTTWSGTFGIPTMYSLLATLVFLFGTYKYKYPTASACPLAVFNIIVAFVSNIFYRWPTTYVFQLYESSDKGLRWMVTAMTRA